MAKIIELCGSPGVGKSTIYKKLISKWKKDSNWVPANHLYPRQPINYGSLSKFLTSVAKRIDGKMNADVMTHAAERFMSDYPEYMDACWSNIVLEKQTFNGSDQRFDKALYLNRMIQRIQVLRESKSDKVAVVDEGLINGINRAMCKSSTEEKDEIKAILEKIPLPDGVVYIECDLEENAERLMKRNKADKHFVALDKDELKPVIKLLRSRRECAIELLKDMGVPVLYLNSTDSPDVNSDKIISFTKTFKSVPSMQKL